jgi:hypothetical protein
MKGTPAIAIVTPNPSLHRTRYGGLRPPPRSVELKRYVSFAQHGLLWQNCGNAEV